MNLKQLLDGIGIKIKIAFGFQGKRKEPINPMDVHCVICGYARKDHAGWKHEFQEKEAWYIGRDDGQV